MKHFVFLLLLFSLTAVKGQAYFSLTDQEFIYDCPLDSALQLLVDKETRTKGLKTEEISFFYWVNFVRIHPKTFNEKVLAKFIATFPEVKGKESASLSNMLSQTPDIGFLRFNPSLQLFSVDHAKDIASHHGKLSHTSSNGLSFAQRIKVAGIQGCAAENLYKGKNDGLLALLMLLLDLGLYPPGHRNNLLNPIYNSMSVSIIPIPASETVVLAQAFSCN